MSNRLIAIKRINKDIKEITNNPVEGIGIASVDDDPMRYVINMRLMTGPYEGYCVQLLLTFSENYPTKPPKILIYPNQVIDGNYHHHIFLDKTKDENNKNFKKFCFDLLDNDFMKTTEEKTGWNPSYSISSLLMQVQNFIADPDMGGHVPNSSLIKQLMDSVNTYTRTFIITDENGNKIKKVHTWKDPYPPMYFKDEEKEKDEGMDEEKEKDKDNENKINIDNDDNNRLKQIKENLTCFMLKVNYIDDPDILLGFPIISNRLLTGRKIRLELYPIPELLTYSGFEAQKSMQQIMVQQYFDLNDQNNNQFKSANNEYYNSWLPIYLNNDHYEKNKDQILKSIAEITSNTIFKEEQIFQVLPNILNSMIIGMCKGKTSLSSSFIKCYFHFILLFKKMCQEYNTEYSIYLNDIFSKIKDNKYSVNKQIIPDIGNFFMVLLFNKVEINTDSLKKIYNALFEDLVIRQMFWMFYSNETKTHVKDILLRDITNDSYLKEFETNKNFFMNNLAKFNQDIHDKNIYETIIDLIANDKGYLDSLFIGKESARKQVEISIKKNFKNLFTRCSKEGKNGLKDIISKNLYFPEYFGITITKENDMYDNFKVYELLEKLNGEKKQEFLEYAFESQKGNKLLLITFFAQKKVEEKGFLDELEKNYGVYLDVDNFIKEMNTKISEIKSYKDLFEYIGTDFMKNKYKDDLELIIDSYKKSLEKNYMGNNRQLGRSNNNLINSSLANSMSSFSAYNSMNRQSFSNSGYNNSYRNRGRYRDNYRDNRHHRNDNRHRHRRSRSRSRSRSDSRNDDY